MVGREQASCRCAESISIHLQCSVGRQAGDPGALQWAEGSPCVSHGQGRGQARLQGGSPVAMECGLHGQVLAAREEAP